MHLHLTLFLILSGAGLTLVVAGKPEGMLTRWLVGGGYVVMGRLGLVDEWASPCPAPGNGRCTSWLRVTESF